MRGRDQLVPFGGKGHNRVLSCLGALGVFFGGGDAEADAVLDNAHLMRLAGRFARRVRAWAADNAVPVIDCTAGERKHLVAEEYLRTHSGRRANLRDSALTR
jgi:hypothetical protein